MICVHDLSLDENAPNHKQVICPQRQDGSLWQREDLALYDSYTGP